jgi:hypothetical protein
MSDLTQKRTFLAQLGWLLGANSRCRRNKAILIFAKNRIGNNNVLGMTLNVPPEVGATEIEIVIFKSMFLLYFFVIAILPCMLW